MIVGGVSKGEGVPAFITCYVRAQIWKRTAVWETTVLKWLFGFPGNTEEFSAYFRLSRALALCSKSEVCTVLRSLEVPFKYQCLDARVTEWALWRGLLWLLMETYRG